MAEIRADHGPRARMPALDGIRAIAVIAVLAAHIGSAGGQGLPGVRRAVGVDIFFVLSGFLITNLLVREIDQGGVGYRAFYMRRILRLMPALVLTCAAVAVVALVEPGYRSAAPRGIGSSLLYVSDFARMAGRSLGLLEHTWSLSIEEQFYLVWPVTVAFLLRRFRQPLWVIVAMVGAVIAIRNLLWFTTGNFNVIYNNPLTRGDALLIGAGLALFIRHRPIAVPRALNAAAWIGLAVITATTHGDSTPVITLGITLTAALAAVIVAHAATNDSALLSSRPMVEIGKRSYGLYLLHYPIFVVVGAHVARSRAPLAIVLTFAAAWLSFALVEQPFLRLKRRWPGASAASVGTAEAA